MSIDPGDKQYTTYFVAEVTDEPNGEGWMIKSSEGWSLWCEMTLCEQRPVPGESLLVYGKGIGFPARGIVIGGRVYRYRTAAEEERSRYESRDAMTRKRQAELDREREDRDRRIAALPPPLRLRMERFQKTRADWRRDFEPYELFVCEEATVIAAAAQAAGVALSTQLLWIRGFHDAPNPRQRELCPEAKLSEHSGNTFGQACTLASLLLRLPDEVPNMHGAMCPLVGCKEYGCRAAYPSPPGP
jgi:hypothetical protein